MRLLIDAGNTRIKWALAEGAARCGQEQGAAAWSDSRVLPIEQANMLARQLSGLENVRQIFVSNVAGETVAQHVRNACAGLPVQPCFIAAQQEQCGVCNGYADPAQLGSDRWAALIAAWHLVHGACLVVNSGTATTIDTLTAAGKFTGGLILPGIELMQNSLCDSTAQLQQVQVSRGEGRYAPFPLNTADALYSGALQASCGAIERQHALLNEMQAPVVLSGGAASVLRERLNVSLNIVDNLVLQGLWLIAQETGA